MLRLTAGRAGSPTGIEHLRCAMHAVQCWGHNNREVSHDPGRTTGYQKIPIKVEMLCFITQRRVLVALPVILTTWEIEIGKIWFETSLGKKLLRPHLDQ
jgi:hypothetical protein